MNGLDYAVHSCRRHRQVASEQLSRARQYLNRHRHGKRCRYYLSLCRYYEAEAAKAWAQIQACLAAESQITKHNYTAALNALDSLIAELEARSFIERLRETVSSFLNPRVAAFGSPQAIELWRLRQIREQLAQQI